MDIYPVDVDPEQIVRWVIAEDRANPSTLRTVARQATEVRNIPFRKELHLGDEEREDLSEVASVATLEIAPAHASEGWLLRVVVEDEVGPRGFDSSAVADGEQRIDVGTFFSRFIRPGRGITSVVAEVKDSEAEARVSRLLDQIEKNRHGPPGR